MMPITASTFPTPISVTPTVMALVTSVILTGTIAVSSTFLDLGLFGPAFGSVTGDANFDEDLDLNNNGVINFLDLGAAPNNFAAAFGLPPGPSANACVPE